MSFNSPPPFKVLMGGRCFRWSHQGAGAAVNDGVEKGMRSRPSRGGVRTGSVQGVPLFARLKLSVVFSYNWTVPV